MGDFTSLSIFFTTKKHQLKLNKPCTVTLQFKRNKTQIATLSVKKRKHM
jgi:hypothetical protein